MNVLPFKLLNEPELVRIGSLAQQCVESWRQNWLIEEGEIDVRATPADVLAAERQHVPEVNPLIRGLDESRWVAALVDDEAYKAIATLAARQVGHANGPILQVTTLLQDVIGECVTALCDEVLSKIAGSALKIETPNEMWLSDARRRGSGAVAILLTVEGERFSLVLSGGLVQQILGPSRRSALGGLVTRDESIQGRRLSVRVVAGEAELNVGSLSSISTGDVILLDADLDALLTLTTPAGDLIGQGHLGTLDGYKALQLSS